jgi:predicted transcriptional regulator of viral defense system
MARFEKTHVPVSHISKELNLEQNQFSVNMGELIKKNVITRVDRGVYCFVDPLLKEYIRAFGPVSFDT